MKIGKARKEGRSFLLYERLQNRNNSYLRLLPVSFCFLFALQGSKEGNVPFQVWYFAVQGSKEGKVVTASGKERNTATGFYGFRSGATQGRGRGGGVTPTLLIRIALGRSSPPTSFIRDNLGPRGGHRGKGVPSWVNQGGLNVLYILIIVHGVKLKWLRK